MKSNSTNPNPKAILKEADELAEYVYGKLDDFPQEEKWYTATKLRSAVVDLLFFVAIASGNTSPTGREFDWINARRMTVALTTMYRFAGRQKLIELDPSIMVRLNTLLNQIDEIIADARKQGEQFKSEEAEKEMKPWLEKYNIYKKLNEGKK